MLIDTHCHLDEAAFKDDVEDVVQRAQDAGVNKLLTIGITAATSRAALELAQRFECVYAVVGIQPNYASQVEVGDWDDIEQMAGESKVVAVGETGLDRYWDYAPIDVQSEYFVRHLELSRRVNKPFVVHCREAEDEVVEHLRTDAKNGPLRGVMHSFCGSAATSAACLELGMFLSFAGMVTYNKNESLREVAATAPLDRIFVETDSPYLTPHPARKKIKRNEPCYVVQTAECLAALFGISVEEMSQRTTENARGFFGI